MTTMMWNVHFENLELKFVPPLTIFYGSDVISISKNKFPMWILFCPCLPLICQHQLEHSK
jgi:hypothetical protein